MENEDEMKKRSRNFGADGEWRDAAANKGKSHSSTISQWIEQFPPFEALDMSPRARLVIVIIPSVFLFRETTVGAAVSGTGTHGAPATSAAASMNDEAVVAVELL
ncbi:hypothetical protein EDB84DRAFT_1566794 [Lactarius hengduanensis]|nr:hypothetical protein EDB84DRAFT_1566794 [Lactarius hengduanensis]